jgi:hypothetical protein
VSQFVVIGAMSCTALMFLCRDWTIPSFPQLDILMLVINSQNSADFLRRLLGEAQLPQLRMLAIAINFSGYNCRLFQNIDSPAGEDRPILSDTIAAQLIRLGIEFHANLRTAEDYINVHVWGLSRFLALFGAASRAGVLSIWSSGDTYVHKDDERPVSDDEHKWKGGYHGDYTLDEF